MINTAPLPMLGLTNPNGQVDLNTIYTQTATAANGDIWFYFAWARDSNTGSGFLSIELEQAPVGPGCNYATATQASLIANCNPWTNRQAGDFILLWDQQGNDRTIYKRVFMGPAGFNQQLTLGPAVALGSAAAQFSADNFRGEASVNLTADVFTPGGCQSFANTIPGTVTGNSDTADYKDTVLSAFPPVSNCGSITVTKYTLDPSGVRFSGTGTFPGGTRGDASTLSSSSGIPVQGGTTSYWRVTYPGDALNNGFTTPCGQESTTVTFTFVQ